MDNELFNEIVASIKEAGAIHRGEMKPSRIFHYDTINVKAIREKTGLSQVQFANKLNISHRTVQNWEQGTRNPTGAAVALINIIDKNPNILMTL